MGSSSALILVQIIKEKENQQGRCFLNGKTERGLQEKRKKENYLDSSSYYGQDVNKESFLVPTAAVVSNLQSVSGVSVTLLFFTLEAQATLFSYELLRCIICHSESWHIPEHW